MSSVIDSERGETATPSTSLDERPTLTSVARRHPRAAIVSLVFVIAVIAVTVLTTISNPRRQPLSDAANCSQWAAATAAQQIAYSHLYINEYENVANTARQAAAVRSAIDGACTHASYLGEAADVSVLAALRHAF
jgi:hypothetical protein